MDAYVESLLESPDPSVAYRAHRRLLGAPDDDAGQVARRRAVARSRNAARLLAPWDPGGTLGEAAGAHAYRKFQGVHWTLAALAELGYPRGRAELRALADQVHTWLDSPHHLGPPQTTVLPGRPDRVRRCASQEGLALWYLHELGLADERADDLAARLVGWQWPDGGWNCDRRPAAACSSVQETLLPLRGLVRHLAAGRGTTAVERAADGAAEFLLERRLLWRRRDGRPISPAWGRDPALIQWPVRFYDVLSALVTTAESGRAGDPRCGAALDLLAGKRLPAGGFPVEVRTARTVDRVTSGGTFADWGPAGATRANPFVSVDAEWVLLEAARARDVAER